MPVEPIFSNWRSAGAAADDGCNIARGCRESRFGPRQGYRQLRVEVELRLRRHNLVEAKDSLLPGLHKAVGIAHLFDLKTLEVDDRALRLRTLYAIDHKEGYRTSRQAIDGDLVERLLNGPDVIGKIACQRALTDRA